MRWKPARSSARSSVGPVFGGTLPTIGSGAAGTTPRSRSEAITMEDGGGWLVITVLVKFF